MEEKQKTFKCLDCGYTCILLAEVQPFPFCPDCDSANVVTTDGL